MSESALSEGTPPVCGRGEVRGVWRRSGRERLAPGLLCRRSVDRSRIGHHCFTCAFLSFAKKKLRDRVEGNDGAPTAPAGAERGGYARGQGLQASPR
eukprot:scaffold20104_cov120-Isochrysis_galbana.AAC.4